MEIHELRILGLTQGEIKVYTAILNIGVSSINEIHEKTGLERRAIYDIINKLIEKGLITYTIEKGKRTYQVAPPNKIREEIEQKKKELKKLQNILPNLEDIYKSAKPKVNLEVFRGKEGIKTLFEHMLNFKDNYFIGGGFYIMDLLPHFWPQYNERRIKKGVHWHSLSLYETKKREVPETRLLELRYLPKKLSVNPAVVFIFGDKIANVLWGEEWFAFMIDSKEIAESYKKYFKYLWDNVAKAL
jgi:sugar-specific transcriptional regulator TrmB